MPSTGGVVIGSSYDEARTRKVNAEAEIAELQLARARGELALVEDVIAAWVDVLAATKAKLMAVPTKTATILATENDPKIIKTELEDQIREALAELSNYDPLSDAGSTKQPVEKDEEGDDNAKTAPKTKRKRVGRPKKTAKLAE
jgi:hypothetical protein